MGGYKFAWNGEVTYNYASWAWFWIKVFLNWLGHWFVGDINALGTYCFIRNTKQKKGMDTGVSSPVLFVIKHLKIEYMSLLEWVRVPHWLETGPVVCLYGRGRSFLSWASFWGWVRPKYHILHGIKVKSFHVWAPMLYFPRSNWDLAWRVLEWVRASHWLGNRLVVCYMDLNNSLLMSYFLGLS